MNARYSTPISIQEARNFMRLEISEHARIPHGSKAIWLSGIRYITDQPGLYLVAGSTGMEGVQIIPPCVDSIRGENAV